MSEIEIRFVPIHLTDTGIDLNTQPDYVPVNEPIVTDFTPLEAEPTPAPDPDAILAEIQRLKVDMQALEELRGQIPVDNFNERDKNLSDRLTALQLAYNDSLLY